MSKGRPIMKLNIKYYFIAGMLLANTTIADVLMLSVRNGETALGQYCQINKCKNKTLDSDTREFANGNTFVRFKESVAQKDILIVVPSILTSNQFIELLIKIRTAKSEFASSVKVVSESGQKSIQVKDSNEKIVVESELTAELISKAGADKLDGTKIQNISRSKITKTQKTVIVDQGTNSVLANNIAKNLGLPLMSVNESLNELKNKSFNVILISSVAEPHNQSFLTSLQQVREFKKLNAAVTLVSPYLPYARSDKKDQNGVSVIGRLAADMIESSGADSVQFVRAHAPQSQGFFKIPTIQTMGRKTINKFLKSQGVEQIISPDAGFQKDATLYADDLGVPVAVINKQRDLQTGESKLHDMSGPNVNGKIVAIIDDETASGGTLGKAAEFLKKQGAVKVIAVVTHLAGSASQALDSPFLEKIAITDTFKVDVNNPKLTVLSIADEISADLTTMLGIHPSCAKGYK